MVPFNVSQTGSEGLIRRIDSQEGSVVLGSVGSRQETVASWEFGKRELLEKSLRNVITILYINLLYVNFIVFRYIIHSDL